MTCLLTTHVHKFAVDNYKDLDQPTFTAANSWARAKSFVCVPGSLVATALDTCVGAAEGVFAGLPMALLCEIGCATRVAPAVIQDSFDRLSTSRYILAFPFKHLLQTINPEALRLDNGECSISTNGNGLIAGWVHDVVTYLTTTKSSLYRHTVSRLVYALAPVAYVIARIADGIIGLAAAPLALLSCGSVPLLNHLAYRGLQAPVLIFDLYRCAIRFINPPSV